MLTLTSPVGAALLAGITIADLVKFAEEATKDPETLEKSLRGLIGDPPAAVKEMHESIREFRSEFHSLLKESGISTLIVLIDDLDRCLPESIISTLEAIKLFLSVPGTAFVIAADERIVRHALTRRYPPESYHEFDLAQDYLDKLVQVPFSIPPMTEIETETYVYLLFAQRSLTAEHCATLLEAVQDNRRKAVLSQPINYGILQSCIGDDARKLEGDFALVGRIAPILARHLGGNPRLVKRFLNTFALRLRLCSIEGITIDQGILAKLMVLERFHRERFEELYEWQLEQDGIPEQMALLETTVAKKMKNQKFETIARWPFG